MSKEYAPLAGRIVELVGGPENIRTAFHCQTRLRFGLLDDKKADLAGLEATDGVLQVMNSGGMYQVVIGMHVKDVFDEVDDVLKAAGHDSDSAPAAPAEKKGPLSTAIDFIAGTFVPVIPAIAGAGMVRAVLSLLTVFGLVATDSQTYVMLNFFADAVFYFLPILLAVSAATKLKSNVYIAAGLGALMVHPTWVALVAAGEPVTLFDIIPVTLTGYSNSVIPILLVMLVAAPFERWLNKVMPKSLNMVFVPLIVFLVMGTLAMTAIGPLGAWLGGYLAVFFTFLSSTAAWIPPLFIGTLWPLMVMFGVHTAVGPLGFAQLGEMGYDNIVGPGILVSNIAQGAAGLTVAFITKDPKVKQIASAGGITGLMGITEPVLYGVNLPKRYPLIAAICGGAAGGLYAGIMQVRRFATGHSGLPALPMYIGDDTLYNLIHISIALGISILVTVILTLILAPRYEKRFAAEAEAKASSSAAARPAAAVQSATASASVLTVVKTELTAPCTGTVVPLAEIPDPVFSSGAMGPGLGIDPSDGRIVSPVTGEIIVAVKTGHAFGIRSDDGVEILVHVGVDTVQMNGAGFTGALTKGTRVEAGQTLVTADLGAIAAAGHPATVVLLVTNHKKFPNVTPTATGDVLAGERVLTVQA
ncbi:beta-glucoside-specific PTS transporter subunit IIABC [Tessaracoccus caeni]|uniref:beta-glucoside-specific PTS transporter subunit IIABC n=1 Tax=Tessaracoccus caeni TaxID=3031239 RepID=UPI0023DC4BBE|nr:beta-glucoside-specific PTS transporter subunit IIABC [Tessaracoccus caeni]MDF1489636.1 beta-glucoside-specific PTS transporter subunit IIABC [Tessaracoccus caeni]